MSDTHTPSVVNDCWNSAIGVRGDRSCEGLTEHVHCRNCPVYADGARALMRRAVPAAYRADWAALFAEPPLAVRTIDRSALVFRIGGEWLSLPTHLCVTVAEVAPVHRLPHRHSPVLMGIVNVKGKLHPCMSLAALVGAAAEQALAQASRQVYPRLLIMRLAQRVFALPVQELSGIHRHAATDAVPPPATVNQVLHRYLTGVLDIEGRQVGCLDAELVGHQLASALQ